MCVIYFNTNLLNVITFFFFFFFFFLPLIIIGMPEVRLTFKNSRVLEDQTTSFHSCVRYGKFLSDRILSFIPPDGRFKLMEYT